MLRPNDCLPALRNIEIIPAGEDSKDMFLLRDPERLSERSITVTSAVLFCLQYFDGQTQVATMQELWRRASGGQELPLEQLSLVLTEMDEAYLFRNERSQQRKAEVVEEFRALPVRPQCYPVEANDLQRLLDENYLQAELPLPVAAEKGKKKLAMLMAPHIDFYRGNTAWALAYGLAKKEFSGDLVLILGTNHQYHDQPAALTAKDYQTPFGTVETAGGIINELAAELPFDPFADEFGHRNEHSIELAATALKHAYGDACPRILPVLCGSLDEWLVTGSDPTQDEGVCALQAALRNLVERQAERLLIVASVDLAHIGPMFGDAQAVDDQMMESCLEKDRQLLGAVAEGDQEAFLRLVIAERNARHICGVAPLYYALSCGDYDDTASPSLHLWRAEDGSGAVTFAVAGLRRKAG